MQALVKLTGPNRKVWFLSEDGETITHIKDNQNIYKLGMPPISEQKEKPIDESVVVINLENDKIYDLVNTNITSITLLADDTFRYCSLHFSSGNSAPSFSAPNGWLAIGEDCMSNTFIPKENTEYSIAIDTTGFTTTIYVLKVQ